METWGLTDREYADLEEEVVDLLAKLIRADTSNPPGNETAAAQVLEEYFHDKGVEATLIGELPERRNCIARLPGRAERAPSLLMMGHLDVVPAEAEEWTHPPFSGLERDGYVWGRGALDTKNQVAAQAVALARLARQGHRLRGTLIFAATADEEAGDHNGVGWLLEHHPDLVRSDFLINEGGMEMLRIGERRIYTPNVGEKGTAQFRITLRGRAGHGATPLHTGNAVTAAARVVTAFAEYEPEVSAQQLSQPLVDAVVADAGLGARLKDPTAARAALRELATIDPGMAEMIEPLLGLTFSPTIVRAGGESVNIIPSHAEVTVDCRTLLSQSLDDVRREVERALADVDAPWEIEFLDPTPGNESPADTPLRDTLEATLRELVPNAEVVCTHSGGYTDAQGFRAAFPGIVAYDFCPYLEEDGPTIDPRIHGVDERIAVRDLVLQTVFSERLARRLLA